MLTEFELNRLASGVAKRLSFSLGGHISTGSKLSSVSSERLASAIANKLSKNDFTSTTKKSGPIASEGMKRLASAVSYKLQKHDGRANSFNKMASEIAALLHSAKPSDEIPIANKSKNK